MYASLDVLFEACDGSHMESHSVKLTCRCGKTCEGTVTANDRLDATILVAQRHGWLAVVDSDAVGAAVPFACSTTCRDQWVRA